MTSHSSAVLPMAKAGDLLPLVDFAALLAAGYCSLVLSGLAGAPPNAWTELHRLTWVAAAIAPFILYDRDFAPRAITGAGAALARGFASRFAAFLAVVGTIAFAGRWLDGAPAGWLASWLACALLFTASTRVLLTRVLRHVARGDVPAVPLPAVDQVADGLPVTLLADRPIRRWSAVLKSGGDLLLACAITIALLPVLACIALAIRVDSPGPILFRQRRHGLNNGEFDIYKFRTMHCAPAPDGAALRQTVRGDSRVTRVGRFLRKWSLDELPQVFNVLGGSMALVGPRPHAVNMRTEERLGHEITDTYPHRHRVRPGITGWSQVNGARGATDTVEQLQRRVRLDLYYIEHWSPLLDLKILTLTFREVLRATNAY